MSETYLGDGLYASFDGYQIRLRAPRIGGDHYVALEEDVFNAFIRFVEETHGVKIVITRKENGDET